MRCSSALKVVSLLHFLTFSVAFMAQQSPILNLRQLIQGTTTKQMSTTLSMGKYSYFTLMASDNSDFLDIAEDTRNFSLLDFLPKRGLNLPFETKKLVHAVTEGYIFHKKENFLPLSIEEDLRRTIDEEYEVKEVPLCLGNWTLEITGEDEINDENVQTLIEVLSLAAMYRLPKEITLVLLKQVTDTNTKIYVDVFERFGWPTVSFPRGLALQLKQELLPREQRDHWWENIVRPRKREQKRRLEATIAVSEAQRVTAPEVRSIRPRDDVLAKIEQQLSQDQITPIKRKEELLFFPNSIPLKAFSLRRFRRFAKRQYSTLKRKGRAGVLSYCVFNLLFYTIGMAWQWQRIAPADPLATTSSIVMVLTRKFARVFASLYVAAQFIKIPKVFGAIALAPYAQRAMDSVSKKLRVTQNVALVVLMSTMLVSWVAIIGALVLGDYARLRQLMYMDEKLIRLYGLQPV